MQIFEMPKPESDTISIKVTSIKKEEEGFSREKQGMLPNKKEMETIAVRLHQQISTANVYSQFN